MKCPNCNNDKTLVTNTAGLDHIVWRSRKCDACGFVFSTSEVQDEPIGYTVGELKYMVRDRSNK